MSTFVVSGRTIELQATAHSRIATRDSNAWLHAAFVTVQLLALTEALRVHTGGRSFQGRPGSKLEGAWYAIGDVIETSTQYSQSRSLPGLFTKVAAVALPRGAILNIGFCSPLFGGSGGGAQAEHVGGPSAQFTSLPNVWHSRSGRA